MDIAEFSIPQLVDCCKNSDLDYFGCVVNLKGLCTQSDYPIVTGECNHQCEQKDFVCKFYKPNMSVSIWHLFFYNNVKQAF